MKIVVAGIGYVGLSNAILLAQNNDVTLIDVDQSKIDLINQKISPIEDSDISSYLQNDEIQIKACLNDDMVYEGVDYLVVATPTNYNEDNNYFDTSSVEKVISDCIKKNKDITVVIKSTIPVGFTNRIKQKLNHEKIFFSPEFLREGKALHDNLYPSRIIVGSRCENGKVFMDLLKNGAIKKNIDTLLTNSSEAEAIKLFANTYLAMRIAYINELDTYAEINSLNSKDIIKGISMDSRIGDYYNNPSFGYGGYCLPKDTKQLLANFRGIPQNIIEAIVLSNKTRKNYIADTILKKNPKIIGIYRLIMKSDSDNFRSAAIIDILNFIQNKGVKVVIYEPAFIKDENLKIEEEYDFIKDFDHFVQISDLIIANRISDELNKVASDKIYSRDIFGND